MNQIVEINKIKLKSILENKGIFTVDQIDFIISLFDNKLPIVVSPSFLNFISNGLTIKVYSKDHEKKEGEKSPAESRNFAVYTEDMEYFIPVDSVRISELNLNDPVSKFLTIEMEGLGTPYKSKDLLTCVLQKDYINNLAKTTTPS
ncbi:hypothetical protein BEN44_19715 [Leptospira interrogans serovar Ricardi]|uniref:hypothetical protein n=1 Tax=Leptospira interrogans TaxID=173 RepID=UPI00215981F2|nr:hypothetical protein [Leptospira interrogans]MCR8640785.1 hypothetical protein [Leptospira interrogans serovar Ricardi]